MLCSLSFYLYIQIFYGRPFDSKLGSCVTLGMVGDTSLFTTIAIYMNEIIRSNTNTSRLQPHMRPNATLQMKNCIGPEWDLNP